MSFPMKRTAYVEFVNKNKVVVGTPYKQKVFVPSRLETLDCVDLVSLETTDFFDERPQFFLQCYMNVVEVYFNEKGKRAQRLGEIKLGQTARFTCVVEED